MKKLKHLDYIQAVISRMANNSFLLKGWSVTLVAALFVVSANGANSKYIAIAFLLVLMFWILDGYYLWQEKLFRDLYDEVSNLKERDINFSMSTKKFQSKQNTWLNAFCSKTLRTFYLLFLATMTIAMYFLI